VNDRFTLLASDLVAFVIQRDDNFIELMISTLSIEDGEEIDLMSVMTEALAMYIRHTGTDGPDNGARGLFTLLEERTLEEAREVANSIRDVMLSPDELVLFLDNLSTTIHRLEQSYAASYTSLSFKRITIAHTGIQRTVTLFKTVLKVMQVLKRSSTLPNHPIAILKKLYGIY